METLEFGIYGIFRYKKYRPLLCLQEFFSLKLVKRKEQLSFMRFVLYNSNG
jgi:hypothetical protein